ncbi:MAG: trigger factor [Acidiferrobacter sp.]
MQVSIEATSGLGRRMKVAVPAAQFEQEFSARLKRLSRTARLPGFRPGRAPLKIVEAQYGGKIFDEVVQDLMRDSFYAALNEQGLKAAGGPAIEATVLGRGKDMEYVATFEVYPEVVRLDLKDAVVERPTCALTDEDVERTIGVMRRQRVTWRPVVRAAVDGDRLTIDFTGTLNGEPFAGGSAHGHQVVLGAGTLLAAFEDGLRGAQTGDHRTVPVTFPDHYGAAELAGKAVVFVVDVQDVMEPVLPALDDAFAAALGVGEGGIEALKAEVRKNLEREAARRIRERVKGEIFKQLRAVNPLDLPQGLVESEANRLRESARANLEAQGVATAGLPADNAAFRERARERVALGIILSALVRGRGLTAEVAKVRQRIEEMGADYDDPARFVAWYYSKPERAAEAESLVLEDEAVDLLLSEAQVQDRPMRFEELV